jgi:hypothetical protein
VLRRKSPQRLTFSSIDRLVFAGLYRLAPDVLDALKIVRPETVIRWHRAGLRTNVLAESRTSGGPIRFARHRLSGRLRAQNCRAVYFGDGITNRGNETMAETQNMIGTVDWKRFGERIRREIEKTGLSLRGIESRLNGPSFTTLNRVCNGTSCTVETYLWLCREFSIGPTWAYRHEQKRRPPNTSRRLVT